MSKMPIIFGLHDHQPLGNYYKVIKHLTNTCYRPFLQAISKFPWFSLSLHVSGILLKWWEDNDSSMIELIGNMVDKGQIELLGGGFYEPILASIPREDRKEQIFRLSEYLEQRLGQRPKGLWLTERVWEDQIIEDLSDTGIKFVVVDDWHFLAAGFNREELYGYYLTESGGKTLAIFPIDERLRYLIPFRPVGELGAYLKEVSSKRKMAIYVDDGEKFGGWPRTHKWVYEDGWLKDFLEHASRWKEESVDWTTFSQIMERVPASGLCYLPTASYEEMEQWALPTDKALRLQELIGSLSTDARGIYRPFLRGGHWKNFLVKYPEANYMHKRSIAISQMSRDRRLFDRKAMDYILSSQCNDAYWHGIFGGLYLPHLRNAVWQSILKAEARLRRTQELIIEESDINRDGMPEVIASSGDACLVFEPYYGGHLVEFSVLDPPNNYENTLTRRPEAYHEALKKVLEQGPCTEDQNRDSEGITSIHTLSKYVDRSMLNELLFDWYRRDSFIDHLFDPSATLLDYKRCDFREWGDFANQPFRHCIDRGTLMLIRDGGLYPPGSSKIPVRLTKSFIIKDRGLTLNVRYVLRNESDVQIDCRFGIEWNIFPAFLVLGNGGIIVGDKEQDFASSWEHRGDRIIFEDRALGVKLHIDLGHARNIWGFPVMTVAQNEKGYETTIQAISIMAHQEISLKAGDEWQQDITWEARTKSMESAYYNYI